ncbi:MAG: beta-aspartyl-peptidase, partial [Proteobacteria bacterium]|nr:beta-aspartyl-peptidase [Pseudomonadota bacterium]
MNLITPVIAIHGGAGTISAASLGDAARDYHQALRDIVLAAQKLLLAGG